MPERFTLALKSVSETEGQQNKVRCPGSDSKGDDGGIQLLKSIISLLFMQFQL